MLTSRYPRQSRAYKERHQYDFLPMFRSLAAQWRPLAAVLREADGGVVVQARYAKERRRAPPNWSPWLLVK